MLLILFPYSYDSAPGQRYRWEQWQPHLEASGVGIRRLHFMTSRMEQARKRRAWLQLLPLFAARYVVYALQALALSFRADYVVVYRSAVLGGPPLIESLLFLLRRKVIYDFDDAIFMRPPNMLSGWMSFVRCDWRVPYICRYAACVSVGNDFLAAFARRRNQNVFIWRTSIDTDSYQVRPPAAAQARLVVGWTGSPSTSRYIRALLPELAALQQHIAFDVLIVGCELDLAAAGVRGECVPWTSQSEIAVVQRMDVGLMPLEDSPWEKGKCSLKALQYQAVGIPAIVSDVGMNSEAVRHEVTGLLVPAGGDWSAPLTRLLQDTPLREKLGRAARAHVEQHFSARGVAQVIVRDLQSLATKSRQNLPI